MAGAIARHPFLGQVLALKGGTALNICQGAPRRLSVDLDFNYIGHLDRERMLEDRPRVEEILIRMARKMDYQVQQSADAFAGRKLFLVYRSATGQNDRIEVDLNFLFRLPIAGTALAEVWQPGELDRPTVRVVSLMEILVGKMLAFLDRAAARDAWDLAHLTPQATAIAASAEFRAWLIALSTILDHPLTAYTRERFEYRITEQAIVEQLAPMLMGGAQLRPNTLVKQSWEAISHLMALTEKEIRFITATQSGKLLPELLFLDFPETTLQVAAHPAIQWKLVNVRSHIAKNRKVSGGR